MKLGLISDTHGLLRPQALEALHGCQRILHAGDIGDAAILAQLAALAPVEAVRGNNDHGAWAESLPVTRDMTLHGRRLLLIHDLKDLTLDPAAAGIAVVISGHSHRPSLSQRDGVLYINPGSAGRQRFKLPIALAQLELCPAGLTVQVLELADGQWQPTLQFRG